MQNIIHLHKNTAHFILFKKGHATTICNEKNYSNVTDDYFEANCKRCLAVYDDAQEQAIMQAEAECS